MLSTYIFCFGDRGSSNTEKKAAAKKVMAPDSTIYDEDGNEEAFCLLCFFSDESCQGLPDDRLEPARKIRSAQKRCACDLFNRNRLEREVYPVHSLHRSLDAVYMAWGIFLHRSGGRLVPIVEKYSIINKNGRGDMYHEKKAAPTVSVDDAL